MNHFAGACVELDRRESVFDVQLATTTIVIQAVGYVGGLLGLNQHHASTDGVHGPCRDEEHVACGNVDPVQQLFGTILADGCFEISDGRAGLESKRNSSTGLRVEHVPALRLAAWLTDTP